MKLCECHEYPYYSERKVWKCSMCNLPKAEPEYSLGHKRILTIHPEHAKP